MYQPRPAYLLDRKYRQIIITASLLVFFAIAALVVTWEISQDLQRSAIKINIAGRQRMLSQRWAKTLLQLEDAFATEDTIRNELYNEFVSTVELFDNTLKGFLTGGSLVGGDGELVQIPETTALRARAVIEEALRVWGPIYDQMQPFLQGESAADLDQLIMSNVRPVLDSALDNNSTLLNLMNDLTFELETLARMRTQRLRIIQLVSVLLALLNFAILLLSSLRQLAKTDAELSTSVAEIKKLNLRLEADRNNLSALFEGFMDNSPVAMWIKDPQRRYVRINEHYAAELEHPKNSLAGKRYEDIMDNANAQLFADADSDVLKQGKTRIDYYEFTTPSGKYRTVTTRFPIFDTSGNLYALGGVAVDITNYYDDLDMLKPVDELKSTKEVSN